jgi:hypothetical protein
MGAASIAQAMPQMMREGAHVAIAFRPEGPPRWWFDFRIAHPGHRLRWGPRVPDHVTGRLFWRKRHPRREVIVWAQRQPKPGDIFVIATVHGPRYAVVIDSLTVAGPGNGDTVAYSVTIGQAS